MTPPIPARRDYKEVAVEPGEDGFCVLLDRRAIRTKAGAPLWAPTPALAEAIAAEWRAAGADIDMAAMTMTRLAMAAGDRGASDRHLWTDEILRFAGSDLLCYRAEGPAALAARQASMWSPFLDWAETDLGAAFRTTAGVGAVAQPGATLAAVRMRLDALDGWRLLGVRRASELLGSAVLALALEAGVFAAGAILDAARLDEAYQAERWGWDDEAAAREQRIAADFDVFVRWLALTRVRRGE